ncbi:MAG TPA: M23 family metallopeptidase [Tenericutes bacterium]|nr:M23 family metallopeptidase [Mycoplasmatota bacterium]
MIKRRIRKEVVYGIYVVSTITILVSVFSIGNSILKMPKRVTPKYDYVSDTIIDDDYPVVGEENKIIRPYVDNEIKIIKSYYDYKSERELQENSIIFYENTYLQNSGVAYGGKEKFDVVSILDGTVISVKEDNLLGKIIQIKHDKDLISVYQSLSEVNVKENDIVKQGDIIGKSGTSNISSSLKDHLHFELIYKGQTVNPEEYFDKRTSQL